ncbi:MAG: hypothetical protein ACE5IM_11330 [Nitrospinota bacterium]
MKLTVKKLLVLLAGAALVAGISACSKDESPDKGSVKDAAGQAADSAQQAADDTKKALGD